MEEHKDFGKDFYVPEYYFQKGDLPDSVGGKANPWTHFETDAIASLVERRGLGSPGLSAWCLEEITTIRENNKWPTVRRYTVGSVGSRIIFF